MSNNKHERDLMTKNMWAKSRYNWPSSRSHERTVSCENIAHIFRSSNDSNNSPCPSIIIFMFLRSWYVTDQILVSCALGVRRWVVDHYLSVAPCEICMRVIIESQKWHLTVSLWGLKDWFISSLAALALNDNKMPEVTFPLHELH